MENGKDDIFDAPGMSPLEALRAKYPRARNRQEKIVPSATPELVQDSLGTVSNKNGTYNASTIDRSVLTIGESHALFLKMQREKQEQLRLKRTQGGLHSKPENPFGLGIPPTRERVKEVIRDSQTPSPPLIPVRPPSDRHLCQKPVGDGPVFRSAHSGAYLQDKQ